jgi:hypothetical protein
VPLGTDNGKGIRVTSKGMPSEFAQNLNAAAAWEHGRDDADRAHDYSETYREPFATEVTDLPFMYADGPDGILRRAYRDGYAVRAQDLADGTAQD